VRWVADECVDADLVQQLRSADHDVLYVMEVARRATDAEVTELAASENRLLLTADKDFGDLIFRLAWRVPGLVLLRTDFAQRTLNWQRLDRAIAKFGNGLFGYYTVVESARFRSRPML
jgi:predicted nuclease of predicted toxin-antitoxin system